MSSGEKRVQINTRERVVSSDVNRMQAFAGAGIAEVLRYLFAVSNEDNAGGAADAGGSVDSPTTAVIVNGLLVRPGSGTTTCLVDPGVVAMSDPDSSPDSDDSPWKWVVDPGVQSGGVLTLTAGGGGIRIDVVECQRTDVVLESDNRDVFNPATGLFTATTVTKVLGGRLAYRIRQGTVGGGYPGDVSGWLPLAVVQVNPGATTWDQCEVWDVRPMSNDFWRQPFDIQDSVTEYARQAGYASDTGNISGVFEARFQGRRAGGKIKTPLSLTSSTVEEPGFAAVARKPWYFYAAFPFGLPRWCKYQSSPGARVPLGFRGVPIYSAKGPADAGGYAGAAITIPTGLGLGGTVQDAVVLAAGYFDSGAGFTGATIDGDTYVHASNGSGPAISGTITGSAPNFSVNWSLVDNTHHPACARKLVARFSFSLSIPSSGTGLGSVSVLIEGLDGITTTWRRDFQVEFQEGSAGTLNIDRDIDFPLLVSGDLASGALRTRAVKATITTSTSGSTTVNTANLLVEGWRLGP